ncbi:MAG: Curved DNA-binding protein (42 kDa protein) [Chaenotheca gracillima]|nr:MAG: Curved DNA-binding protein (42 kDa protein) [Chaenotheca gracillima]
MRLPTTSLCVALLGIGGVFGDFMDENISFGWKSEGISPNGLAIPNWHVTGAPDPPHLLKDRIILTPPYPGNRRGSLWSQQRSQHDEWTAEFDFRATGPERGGGNLQLWYVNGGHYEVGSSSIYTVNRFDGLVLIVDTYGGRGGSIRGFLNDDTVDYKSHHNVDSLAFGHCDYPYRNLGRLTKLQIKQDANGFEVNVDDKRCFGSSNVSMNSLYTHFSRSHLTFLKVKLPPNYFFGISAASAEQPDSFEAYKFTVTSPTAMVAPPDDIPPSQDNTQYSNQQPIAPRSDDNPSQQQIAELQNRLQTMTQQLENLQRSIQDSASSALNRHQELSSNINLVANLDSRIQNIERSVQAIQRDTESKDFSDLKRVLERAVSDSHTNLMEHLPNSVNQIVSGAAPRLWFLIGVLAVFQVLLAVSYVVYKRRRANAPKKYL